MKKYSNYILAGTLLIFAGMSCKKTTNEYFGNGHTPNLWLSTMTVAPPTADSLNNVLALSWTDPHYATATATELYTIQIDSSGRNFAKAVSLQVSGVLYDSISAKELNTIALGFGFSFNKAYNMDIRVVSSYANNNEQLMSNTVTFAYTPYKVPPKVAPPADSVLFIIGSATAGQWNQPVNPMIQQFTRVDSVVYQGTFFLLGGNAYDLLPVNGSWSTKYNVASNQVQGLDQGGAFQLSTGPGNDIPGPAQSGIYTILVNFQTGIFTVTPDSVVTALYVPGDYQGWTPASAPTLASFTSNGGTPTGIYQGYVDITTTNGFKFTSAPDWNHTNYGDTAGNGKSGVLNAGGGNNLNIPATGYYLVQANTQLLTWSATATTWSLIGDFNGWSADVPMTYNAGSQTWSGTISPASAGGFKVRANDAWTINYGTGGSANSLVDNGGNIPITAGTHTITLNLSIPGYYTYSIQ
jgi:hypothetical protein